MSNHEKILDKIIDMLTNDEKIKEDCKRIESEAYEYLRNNGVPYEIYLNMASDQGNGEVEEECYLVLGKTQYVDNTLSKIYLQQIVNFIKYKSNEESDYQFLKYKNIFSKKDSATTKAAERLERYIKDVVEDKNYSEFFNYATCRYINSYDIRKTEGKTNDYIYKIVSLGESKIATLSNNGKSTSGRVIIGIPFKIK